MNTRILMGAILCLLFLTSYTSTSAQTQDCKCRFIKQLEREINRRNPYFIKQIKNAVISQHVNNPPTLQTISEDSILLIVKVFFKKNTLRLIEHKKIKKANYLCYLNPRSIQLDQAILTCNGNCFQIMRSGWTTKNVLGLDICRNEQILTLAKFKQQHAPEIIFTSGFEGWNNIVFLIKNRDIKTLNLKTGIIEPLSENNSYIKNDLNTTLGVMTKPGKIIICH